MPGDYSEIPSWTRVLRKVMKISMPNPHYEVIKRDCEIHQWSEPLYVGHYQGKACATYEVDELYAFFLDEGVPPEFSVFDELDCLFTQ